MKINNYAKALSFGVLFCSSFNSAYAINEHAGINYTWMDAVINKTQVKAAACPEITTDYYGSGFKVALNRSFYAAGSLAGSKWFPSSQMWAAVGIGPMKNRFGVYFSDIKSINELAEEKEKHVPDSFEEINKWKVTDSAYWESQGGVGLYIGAGIAPVDIGTFIVATGGWTNFLQKTGPNRVYVEMAKKKIRSISLGGGLGIPQVGISKEFDKSQGYAFEFILDNQESIEAFERFMAGDMTKAQNLSKVSKSGVNMLSTTSDSQIGSARSFSMATPFIPILSFKSTVSHAYDQAEEKSVWDEDTMKDTGIYVKQRNVTILHQQFKEVRSFMGGKITNDSQSPTGPVHTEKLFGKFKYSYQSNYGQERRLRKYIQRAKSLTGLVDETCARVPAFDDSLGFNQVVLEVNWSDNYVKELLRLNNSLDSKNGLLAKIKASALNYQSENNISNLCSVIDNDNYDDTCTASNSDVVNGIFSNLEGYAAQMKKTYSTDKKEFAKNLTKFGQEVWKSPVVFKAFYDRGKLCGQDFKFEVSGQRISRHVLDQKFAYSAADCTK